MKYAATFLIALLSLSAWTTDSHAYVKEATAKKTILADTSDAIDSIRVALACKMEEDSFHRVVLVDSVIEYSKNFIGYHYKYGSNGQNKSFDCSHFVSYCYKKYGVNIPCSSAGLSTMGEKIDISE